MFVLLEYAEIHYDHLDGTSTYTPKYGEQSVYVSSYRQVRIWCEGSGCGECNSVIEWRVYEHAVAVRVLISAYLRSGQQKTKSQVSTRMTAHRFFYSSYLVF